MEEKTSTSAVVGLVISVIALLLSALPIVNNFAFILALIGGVLGIVGLRKINKGKRTGKKLAVIAIVLAVLSGVVVLASQAFYSDAIDDAAETFEESVSDATGDNTEELLGNSVDVQIGEFTATQDEYGLVNSSLPVTVINKLDETKSYSIQVEAVDSNGSRLAEDYISANELGANQQQEFNIFQYVESEKLEAMKSAEFKVVSVSSY